jgi:hypothetical protein
MTHSDPPAPEGNHGPPRLRHSSRVAAPRWRLSTGWAGGLGLAGIAAYAGVLGIAMASSTYDVWGALVVGPCLLAVSWPLLTAVLRREQDGFVRRVIVVAFAVKVAGALLRWAVAFVLYDGSADAARYDKEGAVVAGHLRDGLFTVDLGVPLVGTGFLILLTGIVYAVIGPTLLGGYLVFAWLGFWGLYLFYRAFRIAMPGANHRRYALLVFLLPSMVFWSSGIGKEAWMSLCIGLATLGAARLLTGARGAALPLALGFLGSAAVRPHMTALIFVATVAGYLFRRDAHRTALTPLIRTVTLAALAVVGTLVVGQAKQFFKVDEVSAASVETVLTGTGTRDLGGGSDFQAHLITSPADVPGALVSVLFRPFPWEAGNVQALATSIEGMLLLGLTVASWGRLRTIWKFRPGRAYVVMCLAYLVMFIYVFSSFNNFGLLARQRVLVYPFLLALLCLPTRRELRRRTTITRSPAPREVLLR